MATNNNPGMSTEILDGNLAPKISLPTDVVLVIDRATAGPSGTVFPVTDSNSAKLIFGTNSPLITAMRHAFTGGAKNVALYRIGGGAARIDNLFGEYTAIYTVDEAVGAGSGLTVYAGPRPNDPTRSCILVYSGTKIVYSNVPGKEINSGVVKVEGFNPTTFTYSVGTLAAPVPFASVVSTLAAIATQSYTATAAQTAFVLTTPVPTATANISVTKTVGSVVTNLVLTTDYTIDTLVTDTTGITLVSGAALGDGIDITYTAPVSAPDKVAAGITFTAGKDSMDADLNTLYELYDTAFLDLETTNAFSVVIADVFDVRNVAAGDDDSADRLTYVNIVEGDNGLEYTWSEDKYVYKLGVGTTTDPTLADVDDNGQPIVLSQFNEVDFAHRLAMWCWESSDQALYVNGSIGSVGPVSSYPLAVNRWIGKAPGLDIYGNIIQNGTGLLGNRFMAGTTTRTGGYYATESGFPDGTPLFDSTKVIIDIGKYLSIPVMPVYVTSEALVGTPVVRSASASYSGLVTSIKVGDSTTNQVLPGVTSVFKIKPDKISALSTLGYVALQDKDKGLTVYSGDLATRDTSDYDYISTAIAVSSVLVDLNTVCDPYIGKGMDTAKMAALYNAIDTELKGQVSDGAINGYNFNLVNNGPNSLLLPLVLFAKDELRAIRITISLTRSATTTV